MARVRRRKLLELAELQPTVVQDVGPKNSCETTGMCTNMYS